MRRQVVPDDGEAVFDELCAGTFVFWFQEQDERGGCSGYYDVRGVRIAPGAEVTLAARWRFEPPSAQLEVDRDER